MRFPRNARVSKGSIEAAPWAAVMFLLVMFVMLGSLLYTPGVHVQLPLAGDPGELPGTDKPTVTVALDSMGQLYFQNQPIGELRLRQQLSNSVVNFPEMPTLVVQADRGATYGSIIRLIELARAAGIKNVIWATLPGPVGKTSAKP